MIDPTYTAVFRDQVWSFYVDDMEACRQATINAQSGGALGGQNFTAALLTLSVIDFCVGYFKGKTANTNGIPATTSAKDVAEFMAKYFTADPRFSNQAFGEKFYQVFRHGLAHSWSPKGAGVGMDLHTTNILEVDRAGNIILQVLPFYDLTKGALKKYETDLGVDQTLNDNFMKRYRHLVTNDQAEANALKLLLGTSVGATGPIGLSAPSGGGGATGPQPVASPPSASGSTTATTV